MPCTTLLVRPAPPPPPPVVIRVTDIRVAPPVVPLDQTVEIEMTVQNPSRTSGSATVVVSANGAEIHRFDTGPIGAGTTEVFSYRWTPRRVGTIRICAEVSHVVM